LQEFAPATTWIPIEIPMESLNWNSHGRRSKLLQRRISGLPLKLNFCSRPFDGVLSANHRDTHRNTSRESTLEISSLAARTPSSGDFISYGNLKSGYFLFVHKRLG